MTNSHWLCHPQSPEFLNHYYPRVFHNSPTTIDQTIPLCIHHFVVENLRLRFWLFCISTMPLIHSLLGFDIYFMTRFWSAFVVDISGWYAYLGWWKGLVFGISYIYQLCHSFEKEQCHTNRSVCKILVRLVWIWLWPLCGNVTSSKSRTKQPS